MKIIKLCPEHADSGFKNTNCKIQIINKKGSACKICRKIYYEKSKDNTRLAEANRAKSLNYYYANKERRAIYAKKILKEKKEEIKKRAKKWREGVGREKYLAMRHRSYIRNKKSSFQPLTPEQRKERRQEYWQKYYKLNKLKIKARRKILFQQKEVRANNNEQNND
jgi:hypothetical protein